MPTDDGHRSDQVERPLVGGPVVRPLRSGPPNHLRVRGGPGWSEVGPDHRTTSGADHGAVTAGALLVEQGATASSKRWHRLAYAEER